MAFCDEKMMEIGQRIKKKRKEAHLTQEELLERIHLSTTSKQSLRSWERGQRLPDLETMLRLCEVFNCDLGYLQADYTESTFDLHKVAEYTGLTEDAVKRLHALSTGKLGVAVGETKVEHSGVISALLSSDDGLEMLNQIAFFQIYSKQNPEKKADDLTLEEYEHFYGWAEQSGKQVVQRRELCEVCLQRAAELFKDACRKMV